MVISLDLYKYFYAAATCCNISEAAKLLFTSQPVVSKYIHRLEDELNVQLFIRTSRGVRLTEEGEVLFNYVKTAFDCFDAGINELQRKQSLGVGQIRIGVSTTLCKYMLLPYLKTYIVQNPNVKISIHCQSTNHTLQLLEQGKIDIGLIGKPDILENITFFDLKEIEDTFVCTTTYLKNLNLTSTTKSHEILDSATVMLLDKSNITRQYIDNFLSSNKITISNLLEISSMDLIIEFTKIGMGVGCVIKEFVKEDLDNGNLIELRLDHPISKRKVGFAIRNQNYTPVALKLFLEMMQIHL